MSNIRIATWNIDRSGLRSRWRAIEQTKVLESQMADLYVVTEAHEGFQLNGHKAAHTSAPGMPPYEPFDRAVGIWTVWPLLNTVDTKDSRTTACAAFMSAVGKVLVYATIIPYHAARYTAGEKNWALHRQGVADQIEDWTSLRHQFADHHLVIAGDFNMTMGGSNEYVDGKSRTKLLSACGGLGLKCLTDVDLPRLNGRSNIDHIVVSEQLRLEGKVEVWLGTAERQGVSRSLSDHNGITLSLAAE